MQNAEFRMQKRGMEIADHSAQGGSAFGLRSKSFRRRQNGYGGQVGGQAGGKNSTFYILHSAFPRGFTLIELLLVMGVIVILVAMLFPVVIGFKDKARKKQALTEAYNIVLALKHYRMEFDQFPNQSQGSNDTTYFTNNHQVIRPLIGQNARGKVFLAIQLQSTNISGGSTNIVGQTDNLGNYIDPWGVPYAICLNENGDTNCLIHIPNVPYYNARAIPPTDYSYSATNYSVANVDVAVASFAGKTNASAFEVETWSEPQ